MSQETKGKKHWTDRVRVILFLLGYVALVEWSYPQPFIQSQFGKLIYFIILFYIVKEVIAYRMENSPRFFKKMQRYREKFSSRKKRLTDYTRYRIQRILRIAFMIYALGWLIDATTERCQGAIACGVAIPTLLVQNLDELIFFVVRLVLSGMGIFLVMFAMARMNLHETILPDSIKTKFSDVYGQDGAVATVKEVIEILKDPDRIEDMGGYLPGGLLMSGPPGVGKSYLAEAAAGETGVPFVLVGPESFTNMFMGVPIMKVKMLFRYLRKMSLKYGGVVCFFDEIDALGSRGSQVSGGGSFFGKIMDKIIMTGAAGGSGALQMLLTEMSGLAKPRGIYNKIRVILGFKPEPPPKYRIVWMAATNMPQSLDEALLRPGRFDRKMYMPYPNKAGRLATFKGYLAKVPNNLNVAEMQSLATDNPKATGASIKNSVNEGLLKAVREGREVVTYNDMREVLATEGLGESLGRQPYEEDQWRVAVHEAGHAVAAHYFARHRRIQYASVLRRGRTGGIVASIPLDERMMQTESELLANIKVSLASLWAEESFFDGDVSTGPQTDLRNATNLMTAMITKFGMGDYVYAENTTFENMSPEDKNLVKHRLNNIYKDLVSFMDEKKKHVEQVAKLLHAYDTVEGDTIHRLLRDIDEENGK